MSGRARPALLLVALLGAAGCGSDGTPPTEPERPDAQPPAPPEPPAVDCVVGEVPSEFARLDDSFHLVLTPTRFTWAGSDEGFDVDFETIHLLAHFRDDDGTMASAVTSYYHARDAATTTIDSYAAGLRRSANTLRSDVEYRPTPTRYEYDSTVDITELTFVGLDDDGDGVADRLRGCASGYFTWWFGDYGEQLSFEAPMTATLDRTPPTVEFAIEREVYHPIDLPGVNISEMISADVDAWYEDADGNRFELRKESDADIAVSIFYRPAVTPLPPFGSDLSLRFSEPIVDFAGNERIEPVEQKIRTAPNPGVFPADGFEGEPRVYLEGGAELRGNIGTLGAISGQTSLWIPPEGRAIIRMTVPNGATRLRAQARSLHDPAIDLSLFANMRVIPANGAAEFGRRLDDALPYDLPRVATGDPTWTQASEIVEFSDDLPLDEDIGDDVFVEFVSYDIRGGWFSGYAGLLIDDLAFE
ncbi:hypothetical protein [Haliangium sp.]|uniref:hypothetical protein n=1 Tax=Haliangium sp. TaxID=2663208 RepID=UPI003D09E346